MRFPMRCLGIVCILTTTACSATMVSTWDDDMSLPVGFRGGRFGYLDQGASSVIDLRRSEGLEKAQEFCGGRRAAVVGSNSHTSQGVMSVPVQQTAYQSGTVSGAGGTANYSGTTNYTAYQTTSYSTTHQYITFVCEDADAAEPTYGLAFKDQGSAGVCMEYSAPYRPGARRIRTIAAAGSSEDCRAEGWVRYLDHSGVKRHLFVGDKGKVLCQKLENEAVQQDVRMDSINIWLRKKLTCGPGVQAH